MECDQHQAALRIDVETTVGDFYDNLFVQCLLQHAVTARQRSSGMITHNSLYKTRNQWHTFLDKLSFLCDWRPAGKSVVAIGAETSNDGVVFRLCGQSSHLEEAVPHLEEVLALLASAPKISDHERLATSATIATNAMARSGEKICSYYERLRRILPEPRMSQGDGSSLHSWRPQRCLTLEISDLLQLISDELPNCSDLQRLCFWAYNFPRSATYRVLRSRLAEPLTTLSERLGMVHHFIGRLGYWHNASISLVRRSSRFADLLRRARVLPLEIDCKWDRPKPRLDRSLEDLASRVFPNFRNGPICSALVRLMQEPQHVLAWFARSRLKCRPHAEAVVTDWFFTNGARFVNDDRYVGCSKRSCFACALYLKLHPAKMQPRPTHGNVWVQWLFPRPLPHKPSVANGERDGLGLLIRMTDEMRQVSQHSVTSTNGTPRRMFESTTGISASL